MIGSLDKDHFGAFGGIAQLDLLEVQGGGALATASLLMDAWHAETMVRVEMQTLLCT